MKVLDPGHKYELSLLDAPPGCFSLLTFVKRQGDLYPGNESAYPGTNIQEVLRALIDRVEYLDAQIPCMENKNILEKLRDCFLSLEYRAADRHDRDPDPRLYTDPRPEKLPFCPQCGHVGCGCPEEEGHR